MKTIGFVDYYISEWHANNYHVWIKELCESTGKEFCVKCAWSEREDSPFDGRSADQWCKDFGVERCKTIAELCEKCDYILVLAPSDPEKHLEYAREVLKYGKNTYIDKTFAPDYAEAKEIFDIAQKYNTKFFSSSALRYATELDDLADSKNIIIHGGGGNMPEYIVHQVEIAVKLADTKPVAVRVENQGTQCIANVKFEGGKAATMLYSPAFSFAVCAEKENGESAYKGIESDFFKSLIADILNFYETGEYSFDTKQTLDIMKIREAIICGVEKPGEWINL